MARHPIIANGRARAKSLRASQTRAEEALWRQLRAHRFGGLGFRRQVPIGPYVVDFVCQGERVIVEVDGGGHGREAKITRDAERSDWLAARGYRVVRFWNTEVLDNLEGVLMRIGEACGVKLTPPPGTDVPTSPSRREVKS